MKCNNNMRLRHWSMIIAADATTAGAMEKHETHLGGSSCKAIPDVNNVRHLVLHARLHLVLELMPDSDSTCKH